MIKLFLKKSGQICNPNFIFQVKLRFSVDSFLNRCLASSEIFSDGYFVTRPESPEQNLFVVLTANSTLKVYSTANLKPQSGDEQIPDLLFQVRN